MGDVMSPVPGAVGIDYDRAKTNSCVEERVAKCDVCGGMGVVSAGCPASGARRAWEAVGMRQHTTENGEGGSGMGGVKATSEEAVLPPRPLAAEVEGREVALPWTVLPAALLLGTIAGGAQLARHAGHSSGGLLRLVEPALWALATGAVNCALVVAFVVSDRVLRKWRREVRWPVAVLALGALAAGAFLGLRLLPLGRWMLIHMGSIDVLLLAAAGATRGMLLAALLGAVCRAREGVAWKTVVAGVAFEVVFLEVCLAVLAWVQYGGPGRYHLLWEPLEVGWRNMSLREMCPAGLALAVSVGASLHWARKRVPLDEGLEERVGRRRWGWRRVGVVALLLVVAWVGMVRLGTVMLRRAVVARNERAVSRWLALGVNPNRFALAGWELPLHRAARHGDQAIFERLLRAGADIESTARHDASTALHYAASGGRVEMMRMLIDRGADVNASTVSLWRPSRGGLTPLHGATDGGNYDAVVLLLEHGADPNAATGEGVTPLHNAAYGGIVRMVILLLDAGADPNAQDAEGWTPLHGAAISRWLGVERVLLQAGADPNAQDDDGMTPLHVAADQGKGGVARALVAAGADVGMVDGNGRTAADVARQRGHVELAEAIENAGG